MLLTFSYSHQLSLTSPTAHAHGATCSHGWPRDARGRGGEPGRPEDQRGHRRGAGRGEAVLQLQRRPREHQGHHGVPGRPAEERGEQLLWEREGEPAALARPDQVPGLRHRGHR